MITTTMNDPFSPVVEQIRDTIDTRLRELLPALTEAQQLTSMRAVLDGSASPEQLTDITARLAEARGGPDGRAEPAELRSRPRHPRRGTRRGTDGRAPHGLNKQRILATILEHPGIAAPEIADRLGIKRTVVSATITRLKNAHEVEPFDRGVRIPSPR